MQFWLEQKVHRIPKEVIVSKIMPISNGNEMDRFFNYKNSRPLFTIHIWYFTYIGSIFVTFKA